jgi:hypothetical protein
MVSASRNCLPTGLHAPAYDEQIIAREEARVQPQDFLWFLMVSGAMTRDAKKRAAVSGGF